MYELASQDGGGGGGQLSKDTKPSENFFILKSHCFIWVSKVIQILLFAILQLITLLGL